MGLIHLVFLVPLLLAVLPVWRYSRGWGWWPAGILGVIVLALVLLILAHRPG